MNLIDKLIALILEEKSKDPSITTEELKQLADYLQTKKDAKEIVLLDSKQLTKTVTKSADGSLRIKVIASTRNVDRDGDMVVPEGIQVNNPTGKVPFLLQHYWSSILGYFDKWYVEGDNFIMEGFFLAPTLPEHIDARNKMLEGALEGISIGFIVQEAKFEIHNELEVRVFSKTELLEASLVTIPSNRQARVLSFEEYSKSVSQKVINKSSQEKEMNEAEVAAKVQEAVEAAKQESDAKISALTAELEAAKKENETLKGQNTELEAEANALSEVVTELNEIKSLKLLE